MNLTGASILAQKREGDARVGGLVVHGGWVSHQQSGDAASVLSGGCTHPEDGGVSRLTSAERRENPSSGQMYTTHLCTAHASHVKAVARAIAAIDWCAAAPPPPRWSAALGCPPLVLPAGASHDPLLYARRLFGLVCDAVGPSHIPYSTP
jgi:hypothetical protein